MAAPGPIQMTVVSLAEQGRSHGIRHFKLDAWRSGRPTPLGETPASGLAAVTLNRTRHAATTPRSRTTAAVTDGTHRAGIILRAIPRTIPRLTTASATERYHAPKD